jgi:hypothetical protein
VYAGRRLRVSVAQYGASPADPAQIAAWRLSLDDLGRPVEKLKGLWTDAGDWLAVVEPGERYLVKAWASDQQYDWTVVDVLPASYETVASLALFGAYGEGAGADAANAAKERWAGRLELVVLDEKGRALEGWRATVRASDGTVPRGWSGAGPGDGGKLPPLFPGDYTLEVETAQPRSLLLLTPEPRPFSVRAGAVAREEVRGRLGARIRLATMAGASLASLVEPGELGADDDDPREPARARAFVRAKSEPASARRRLTFLAEPTEGPKERGQELELGLEATCDPLLPDGRYVVTVETDTGASRDFEVELAPGKVREIEFVAPPAEDR